MALTMQWCWNQTGYFKDASETLTQTEKIKNMRNANVVYIIHIKIKTKYMFLSLSLAAGLAPTPPH